MYSIAGVLQVYTHACSADVADDILESLHMRLTATSSCFWFILKMSCKGNPHKVSFLI